MQTELGALLAQVRVAKPVGVERWRALLELTEYLQGWTDDELEVLGWVAARLDVGRAHYGGLRVAGDGRSWLRELLEERGDELVYLACAAIASGVRE